MTCDVCKQNEASVFYTSVIGAKIEKAGLCESCATKMQKYRPEVTADETKRELSLLELLHYLPETGPDGLEGGAVA